MNGMVTFELVFIKDVSIEYHINGQVTSRFYQENKNTIDHVLRSFEATEGFF
ncbi:hypothetical protein [Bacillus dakarensis]|uniref:hypothetical protein n=1 Tax=Robertmurraya dakarensis TaxID=1926278 RepID=UPI0012B69A2E|nr:hypothetical protein [Bacillus dakarensis]